MFRNTTRRWFTAHRTWFPCTYSTADVVATGLLSFGAGIAVGALMSGGCCGWGYSSWTCNWYGGGAYYRRHPYYGNAAWHGGYYGNSAPRMERTAARTPRRATTLHALSARASTSTAMARKK